MSSRSTSYSSGISQSTSRTSFRLHRSSQGTNIEPSSNGRASIIYHHKSRGYDKYSPSPDYRRPSPIRFPRVQKLKNDQNICGTAAPHAIDVDCKDENESNISVPQLQLSLQPIKETGGEPSTRSQVQVLAESRPNSIGVSSQIIAQGFTIPIYVLTPMIKLPELLNDREDNFSTDEVSIDMSYLEANKVYNISYVSQGLPQAWPVYQEDAGGYGSTTSPDRGTTSSIAQPDNPTAARISPVPLPRNKRPCYYLLGGLSTGIVSSFALALWWARSQGDLSAGFTLGSYVVGVDALVVAAAGVFHAPSCRCWTTSAKSED
ncbi:hypothetical protein EV127DRAFT_413926 [Xylaria flabelliformis]|nr:hypothetical protein EV127DRAFT_413926 [Xylaria flabelliformis]